MTCTETNAPLMALVDAALSDSESSRSTLNTSEEAPKQEEQRRNTMMEKLSFAEQLMTVLDDETCPHLTWMPNGKSFTIKNPKQFTSDQMPKIFNIRNMSSFVRKLSRWGFNRYHEKETMNSDLFRHKDFQKGNWKACSGIRCSGRHPVTSILRNESPAKKVTDRNPPSSRIVRPVPVSPTSSISDVRTQSTRCFSKPLPILSQPGKTTPVSSVLADAALQSFMMEQDIRNVMSDPNMRSKMLALLVMKEASQQQHDHFSQQALLQSWLAHTPVDIHRVCLALAASLGNFSSR